MHNGAVGLAHPVDGIVIDGNLEDWPSAIPSYPVLNAEYGAAPLDATDLDASVRFAYDPDESALLIAFEVEDDDVQISTRPDRSWDTEDGVEVYLDLAHNGETIRQFALRGDGTKRPASG
ncbi:MAG: sugar-binding protein [Candidatus Latescibacterota bacterium]|nr:sugar-binding protein [Candidatus Latescibacterota bacterium]